MRPLLYVRLFRGSAGPIAIDGNVLAISASAAGCAFRSWVDDGLDILFCAEPGEKSSLTSELVFTGTTTYQQTGTIDFEAGRRLRFSTIGNGYLQPQASGKRKQGAAIWRIDEGEGALAGAHGLITSNIQFAANGDVTDYQIGIVTIP